MDDKPSARLVGINHVALEVGDIDQALAFYGRVFSFDLRGRGPGRAFLDMGDQFLALMQAGAAQPDAHRHFGLVVDDRSGVREAAAAAGATPIDGPGLDFLDPWGNHVQVVDYRDVQFTRTGAVLRYLGVDPEKTDAARAELAKKGISRPPRRGTRGAGLAERRDRR